jgi:hypothetical protein
LRAELDAYGAWLYGLSRDELRYALDPQEVYGSDISGGEMFCIAFQIGGEPYAQIVDWRRRTDYLIIQHQIETRERAIVLHSRKHGGLHQITDLPEIGIVLHAPVSLETFDEFMTEIKRGINVLRQGKDR